MKSYIYSIKNLVNGKCYIGSTNYPRQRKSDHFCSLKKGTHHSSHLQKSYNKHGKEAFEFSIIEECESSDRKVKELHYISIYRAFERDFGYNIYEPDEINFKCSSETKIKIRATKKDIKPIDVYLINGEKVNSFPSIKNCSLEMGIDPRMISSILTKENGRKSIYGYTFEYKDNPFSYKPSSKQRFKKTR